jgi:hypothetical protein
MDSASGTVTVFATANESFTSIDNSTGSAVSIPGSASNDYLFTFSSPGTSPQLTGQVDADAAMDPVSAGSDQTAFSDVLDGPAIAAANQDAPAALATDAFGQLVAGTDTLPDSSGGGPTSSYLPGAADWAKKHAYPGTKKDHLFSPDCTDFGSRATHLGGGMPFNVPKDTSLIGLQSGKSHLNYWYDWVTQIWTQTSYSWADAHNFSIFLKIHKGYFMQHGRKSGNTSQVQDGMIIFGAMHGGGFGKIDHTGVVTNVTGRNIFITQHSVNRLNEPLWAISGHKSWFGRTAKLRNVWVVWPIEG